MCGIAGFILPAAELDAAELEARARRMAGAIAYRGPDAEGYWCAPDAGVALAHRRLAILDLTPAGAQPMASADGALVIVFNGEIYNFRELRAQLPAQAWRGHSDTEVLLAAITAWGLEAALGRCVGMFAFALWDRRNRELILARDRLGEKPLYYGTSGGALLFGSELKALTAWPGWRGAIDRAALDDFTRHSCIHAPRTIYRDVRKLPAGCLLRVPRDRAAEVLAIDPRPYWSLQTVAAAPPAPMSEPDAIARLEALLAGAVAGQMVADVPVGAFLSGGIDSSLIVALMQRASGRAVKTFSIGFNEDAYNEAHFARAVAVHLGTDHTELYVNPADAMAVIPRLAAMYDEPFADSSQIPTHLVAQLARRSVTVSLSGDGGDELFGGYNRYFWAERIWRRMRVVPVSVRGVLGAGVRAVPPAAWDAAWKWAPRKWQLVQPGDKLHKLAGLAAARNGREAYAWLIAQHRARDSMVEGVGNVAGAGGHALWGTPGRRLADDMMLADALGYLPDDILVKVDRATMATSLESRTPFLDHRVVEFAFGLPIGMKIRAGQGKWLLRQLLYRHVPQALIERPKMGFGVPIDSWLRGPLKEWAAALLEPRRLAREGFLRPAPVTAAWNQHQGGRRNLQHLLWNVLMFQAWLESVGASA